MSGPSVGFMLRVHEGDESVDIGKVIEVEQLIPQKSDADLRFWYIEFPEFNERLKGKSKRHYLKAPIEGSVAVARQRVASGELSFVELKYPSEYYLSDEELSAEKSTVGLSRKSRRNLPAWKKKRDKQYAILAPLVKKYGDLRRLLRDEKLCKKVLASRAKKLKHKDANQVTSIFRRWLMGGCAKNALLPAFSFLGQPGSEKYCKSKTGAPNKFKAPAYNHNEADRKKLRIGWKRFKKKGVSVHSAYILTMNQYWAKSVRWITSTNVEVDLVDAHLRPTEVEFALHGPKGDPEASAMRINLGNNNYLRNHRGLHGTSRDRIFAAGLLGVIDATSEDQRPVSRSSRLLALPSSWRTMIVDGGLNYIFGVYRGFEKGGTLPALMAMLHASMDKIEWAKQFGFNLKPGDWHKMVFKRVRGDNGDLKSENGIATLTSAEISLEIVRSYAAEYKIVEATHHIIHRGADHLAEGTTHGKLLQRGESDGESAVTMWEMWAPIIKAILYHNNEDPVPQLLTLEMRNAGVGATRREILEFMMREGYVVSEPYELDLLRAQCLPKLAGSIKADGIHIFDPRPTKEGSRYIPQLVYWDKWLHDGGWTTRGRSSPIPISVHLDPSFPSEAWVNIDGMKRLPLRHADPEMHEVPLADWLWITDSDDLMEFLKRGALDSSDASRLASAQAMNKLAKKEKRAEEVAAGGPAPKNSPANKKRQNLEAEKMAAQLERLGVSGLLEARLDEQALEAAVALELAAQDADALGAAERLMKALRAGR